MDDAAHQGEFVRAPCPDGVCDRLGLLTYKVGAAIIAGAEPMLESVGLCGREYAALAVLACDEPQSQQELAVLMGKAPAVVVAIVDELERKGFVERVRSPSDRRRIAVRPTVAGAEALERGDRIAAELERSLFGALDADERATLHGLLRRTVDAGTPVVAPAA